MTRPHINLRLVDAAGNLHHFSLNPPILSLYRGTLRGLETVILIVCECLCVDDVTLGGTMAQVLIVDEHAAFRQPLAFLFNREPDLTVVAQTGSVAEGRRMLEEVDIAVVDLDLPDGKGMELVREMRTERPHTCVLALTHSGPQDDRARDVEVGTCAILGKSAGLDEIMHTMAQLCMGMDDC